ncbi:hypothetical protein SEA_DIMINIMUS_75 [Mycobacterium phage Diminimus]|uniref:Uncharacterized protein n=5 Tax=Bongovirus bongo TaxID=1983750 RepID=A0A514DJ69_9CAUD|nr:cysteine dioxygenase [Mycobacterium phage PegLeg]YP_009604932.1 cysteine dioxygenase [Mycobacterium phage Bongo]AXQ52715.1 hypothetical protein SEA_IPHANE7_74 [Mycobacterium phage IPhane7]QDH93648.1 hypothetical protein SEA_LILHOMIEP_74 [Mycobacterium phage LilhomieP]QGJ93219.1 hypothetical protein SEA_TYDAWG_74 [Mycobacterium phage TyDawg]QUU29275.1 hypothetical protein [Mycobacterium phage SirSheldon]WNM75286.1 hypothetical protein SEA_AUSPICE_74 [Mycobacterium phage Auspice]WNN95656.1 
MRDPDVILTNRDGDVYLKRWHIIPRNRFFNIYLHQFLSSDDDRALHDHPWWFASLVLKGGYWEHRKTGWATWRGPGSFAIRRPKTAHRVELATELAHVETIFDSRTLKPVRRKYKTVAKPAWTLIFTGPRFRSWGFHCPQGWTHWKRFTDRNGCGER